MLTHATPGAPPPAMYFPAVKRVHERTGLSTATVHRLIKSGALATTTIGRRRLTTDAAIDACIAAGGAR